MTADVVSWDRPVGLTVAHPQHEVRELGLHSPELHLAVWTYGATVVEVGLYDGRDPESVVLRLPTLRSYERRDGRAYIGSTIGRFARIVARGRFQLDDCSHQLVRNAGDHHIHGGERGFDSAVWHGRATGGRGAGEIVLELVSQDGDQGYPGEVRCTARFSIAEGPRLEIAFEAETDAPTLVGLSNHVFWNLSGAPTIDGHVGVVRASRLVESDDQFAPTGHVVPIPRALDLRGQRLLRGVVLDHCVVPDPGPWAVRLAAPDTGRVLWIATDQPCIALYTGEHLPDPRAGICVQPGPFPDAPNHPAFPPAVLRPSEIYRSRTQFAFGDENPWQ